MSREELADAFFGPVEQGIHFAHGHTFAGNPLACAAGIAVLDEIVEKELDKVARRLGEHLATRLETLQRYGVIREVRGKGTLRGVELVQDTSTMAPFPQGNKLGDALKVTALKNGLIMRIDADWFAVSPPLIASEADIDEMCDRIEISLSEALHMLR